jgi:hypothetical protein
MGALQVAQLAERLSLGYYSHVALLDVAAHPQAIALVPAVLPGHAVPIGLVRRKDGTSHAFDFKAFMNKVTDPLLADDFKRVWPTGALIALGDALASDGYFDHAPILEMVYHLRNGVAHGNHFTMTRPGLERLGQYPAHTRDADVNGDGKMIFEVSPELNGKEVLFDYMEPGNVLDVLMSVGIYLRRLS